MANLVGQPSIKGSSEAMRMILLNFATIGITFTWGVELTYCTPYLLNLGLTKSNTSLIWIAGPLSGLVVQPVIGVIADENTSKWGRRRPFMVIGTAIVAVFLLVLGFTKEIVSYILPDETLARGPTIALAVLSIYVLDFAINAVMSCARSLVVDTLPLEKQQAGAAWANKLSSVGGIIGYAFGALDLVEMLGTSLGKTQFQQLTVIASAAIMASTGITCWAVRENVLVTAKGAREQSTAGVFRQISHTIRHLPPRIQGLCWAQFWSWIGWFPFLFYSTTWVGETYFRYNVPAGAKHSDDVLGEMGRIGSTALVMYSTVTCLASFALPVFVKSSDEETYTARPPAVVAELLRRYREVKPDLLSAWLFGQLMFAVTMSLAPFATSFRFATTLVCLCGIPWAIAGWAPTALLGIEVNKMSGGSYAHLPDELDIELPSLDNNGSGAPSLLGDGHGTSAAPISSTGELSGIYFGILNIYTTIPQFVGTIIASSVFAVLEPGKSRELTEGSETAPKQSGPNAIAVCLFIGAICSVMAYFATRRLRRL